VTNYISTGCEGGTGKGQANPAVPAGDDKHTGQGTGEVEEEIRVLDPRPPHGREGGREGSVGRDTRQPSPRPVGTAAEEDRWQGLDDSRLFFVDTRETTSHWDYWIYPGAILYHHVDEQLLGEPERPEGDNGFAPRPTPGPRCFNCGSTEHLLSSCPDPRNRALIDLSRQLFEFFADDTSQNWKRIHEVVEWRSRRLEWTRIYSPGEITGSLLRDALGSRDADGASNMPWLENVSLWGYPPGWISHEDPVERVRRRILDEDDPGNDKEPNDSCLFAVHNGTPEDSEVLRLGGLLSPITSNLPSDARNPRRWATYPNTHFLSDILPAYTGRALPPLAEEPRLDGRHETSRPSLPSSIQPPPPPNSPPPLPPSIPRDDLSEEEVDMDLSD
jgi:zinc finger CCHC domain-containing protein 8